MSHSQENKLSEFTLNILQAGAPSITHQLQPGRSVFIGQSETCGIRVAGTNVADIHVLVDVDADVVSIQDWASDVGTQVNGQTIDDKVALKVGDRIQIGEIEVVLTNSKSSASHVTGAPEASELDSVVVDEPSHDEPSHDEPSVDEPSVALVSEAIEVGEGTEVNEHDAANESRHLGRTEPTNSHPAHQLQPPAIAATSWDTPTDSESEMSLNDMDVDGLDEIAANDWDNSLDDWSNEDEAFDADTVNLLRSEIEDLRIQLAARDEQIALLRSDALHDGDSPDALEVAEHSDTLVNRMDDMLAEMSEHDERVRILQELLETAEIQNQAEKEERRCLENWLGEIEQRVSEREAEWKAESDGIRERLDAVTQQRDQLQKQIQDVARRYDAPQCHEQNIEQLQQQNDSLAEQLDALKRENAGLAKQVASVEDVEPESLQEERAKLAKERADVSRLRFQLSKQLSEFDESTPEVKAQPDREFALRLKTLREHLREIHEEEKETMPQKSDSLFGRISGLWKRVEDEY